MDNNLQGLELFIGFGLLGLFISIITWVTLKAKFKYLFAIEDSSFISCCIVIGITFGTPAFANFYNRTNPKDLSCKVYRIQKMEFYHGKRGFHHIYVNIGQSEERLKVIHETWHKLDGQNTVKLCVANGGLGFEYIETIDVP